MADKAKSIARINKRKADPGQELAQPQAAVGENLQQPHGLRQAQIEQARLRELLAGVPGVVWEVCGNPDEGGQLTTYINEYVESMLGYTVQECLSTPDFWLSIIHPEDRERTKYEMMAAIASGQGLLSEFRAVAKAGRVLWCEAHTTVIYDESGQAIGLRGVTMDVTNRKQTEELLRWSEASKRAVVDAALDCIITIDVNGNVLEWNAAAEQVFGYSREQALGRDMAKLIIPPALRERHRQGLARYLETDEGPIINQRLELTAIRADGSEFPVELTVTPVKLGESLMFTGYLRDISEHKAAAAALSEQIRLASLGADIGVALTQGDTLRDMLQRCAESLVAHLDPAFARIWTVDEAEQVLVLRASAGMYTHLDGPHGRVPIGHYKIGLIAEERKPHLTNAVLEDPRVSDREWARREGMVAFAGYPLIVEDRLLGVMAVFARRTLTEATLNAMGAVASEIALGIQRKQTDELLRYQLDLTQTITDNATAALFMMDSQGRTTFMNPAAERMFGLRAEEVKGKVLHDVIHYLYPDGRPYPMEECPIDRALPQNNQIRDLEDIFVRSDGTLFPVKCAASPIIKDGVPIGTVIEVRDVTEEKRAQQALRRSSEEIRTIFESITDAFFAVDREWRFTYLNAEAERILGLQRAEALGQDLWNLFPDAVNTAFYHHYHRALAENVPVAFEEFYAPFDQWFWVHAYPSDIGLSVYFRDITERKQAEAERAQLLASEREARQLAEAAEQRFRNLVNEVEAIVWEADATTLQFSFVSQRAEQILGYPVERWTTEPDFWPSMIHPDDRNWAVDYCVTATRAAQDHTFEYRAIATDGRVVWLRDIVYVARDAQGRPDKLRGIMVDITERKLAEEETARLSNHIRLLLESTSEGIFGIDREGNCTFINYAGAALLGYTPEELIGRNMHTVMHHSHWDGTPFAEETCPIFHSVRQGQSCRIEDDVFWRRDGSGFYAAYSSAPMIVNGAVSGAVVAFYDITERKRAEDALRFLAEASTLFASSLDYQNTLRSLSELVVPRLGDWYAVFLANDDGTLDNLMVMHRDPEKVELARQLLQRYPPSPQASHGVAQVIRSGDPELIPSVPDDVLRSIARDATHLEMLRKLGLRSWMVVPLLTRGRVLGAIAIVAAESGRHYDRESLALAEELARRAAVAIDNARLFYEAQSLNADLERRVQERTAELESALKELESFSYSVSHDLRAPLRSMDGFSLALIEDYGDKLDEVGRDYLERVRAASQRMAQLIDDLLQLSRVTRSELIREQVDLSAVARSIAAGLQQQQPARKVRFSIADGMSATGDPRLLQLALANLLDNAWKFTSRCEQAVIEMGELQRDGKRIYYVKDNGAGFDMNYADKLFGAFQRLHSDADFQGSGIGLATVQRILRRHGGQVWAEGSIGEGATFYFTL